jgi:hypothetical protein
MAFFIVTASGNLKSYIILTRIGSVTENWYVSCEVRSGFLYPRRRRSS